MGIEDERIPSVVEEIESFADIGEFFDHPIKTYSSGMYSRLSFAAAVSVSPDILIVDEVLSVGDIRFSQKCLRKMHSFKEEGKTILFVTHSTQQIGVFCDRVMWIMDGEIYQFGDSKKVTENYKNYMTYGLLPSAENREHIPTEISGLDWLSTNSFPQIGGFKIAINEVQISSQMPRPHDEVIFRMKLQAKTEVLDPYCGWMINDQNGLIAAHSNNVIAKGKMKSMKEGELRVVEFNFRLPPLNSGTFTFSIGVGCGEELDHRIHDIFQFEIPRIGEKNSQAGYVLVENETFLDGI
jgi:ABC-type proline/glycine betaine transport system ATPase subunit